MNDDMIDRLRETASRDYDASSAARRIQDRVSGVRIGTTTHRRRRMAALSGIGAVACLGIGFGLVSMAPAPASAEPLIQQVRLAEHAFDSTTDIMQIDEYFTSEEDEMHSTSYITPDGSAMRAIYEDGGEENFYANADGSTQYVYVNRSNGTYTDFDRHLEAGDQPLNEFGRSKITTISDLMSSLDEFTRSEDVATGPAQTRTIEGRVATCFTVSGEGLPVTETSAQGRVRNAVQAYSISTAGPWSTEYCFDDKTDLPLLISSTGEPGSDNPNSDVATRTTAFTWHQPTTENTALLHADTTGLTRVDYDPTTWTW